jgi:alpha-glucosidase
MPDLDLSRDPQRTPMQWDASAHGGFTNTVPWLPMADDYRRVNVEAAQRSDDSVLTLYRRLIALRRAEPAFRLGKYVPVPAEGNILAYLREFEGSRFLVILNLAHRTCHFAMQHLAPEGKVVLDTIPEREGLTVRGRISLNGDEGMVIKLS